MDECYKNSSNKADLLSFPRTTLSNDIVHPYQHLLKIIGCHKSQKLVAEMPNRIITTVQVLNCAWVTLFTFTALSIISTKLNVCFVF